MPRPPRPDKPARGKPVSDKTAPDKGASGERIAKVLARAGVASRRDAEAMIVAGRVQVNGRRIDSPALNVTPKDRVQVDGQPLAAPEPARLWLYHKPLGLVTSARDEKGRATVFEKLPEGMPRVMPVGRLDINSEGLLLLTNDGEVKRKLELPATGWLRKYRVRVNGKPGEARLEPLRQGITVEGERFQPMQVTLDRQQGSNAWLTVGIREGKNREVRRAMEAVGLIVNRLIRTGYGPFQLGDLAPGAVEEVRPRVLRDQLGLDPEPDPARPAATARPARTPRVTAKGTAKGSVQGTAKASATGTAQGAARKTGPRAGGAPAKPAEADTAAPARKNRSWGSKGHGGSRDHGGADLETRKPRSWGTKRQGSVPGGAPARKPRETGPKR